MRISGRPSNPTTSRGCPSRLQHEARVIETASSTASAFHLLDKNLI
jgi:hypothetical protein